MEILAFISFAALVLVWIVVPNARVNIAAPHEIDRAASRRTIRVTTEYDGGAPGSGALRVRSNADP